MMNVPPPIGGLRFLRAAVLLCMVMITVLTVLVVFGFLANQQSAYALCALRADLDQRVVGSQEFLRDHPHGIPGIPAKTIRDGIRNQQRTIRALKSLSC